MTIGRGSQRGNHSLPDSFSFEGVELGPPANYLKLVREQLKDGSVWPSGDSAPLQGVRRVIDSAEGTPAERALINALVDLLSDDDTGVRTDAIHLLWDYADKIDPSSLLKALNDHPNLYEGVKPVGTSESYMPDLSWGLLQAMNASRKSAPEVIAALRRAAEDPANGFRVLGGLAGKDSAWVIEHAHRLISGQPVRARIVLANLSTPERRERFVRAMAGEPAEFRQELTRIVDDKVKNAGERQRLTTLLA